MAALRQAVISQKVGAHRIKPPCSSFRQNLSSWTSNRIALVQSASRPSLDRQAAGVGSQKPELRPVAPASVSGSDLGSELLADSQESGTPERGSSAVRSFYEAINARDIDQALIHIAESCVYEDLIYSKPFVGKAAVKAHFENVLAAIPKDVLFVIDNITEGGGADVGMTWHAELGGRKLPFSRGCSFYRCDLVEGNWRIVYARDIPEPTMKPGNLTLSILSAASFILQRLPK